MKPIVAHILFFVAVILLAVIGTISWFYTIITLAIGSRFKDWYKRTARFHEKVAIILDIAGNVLCQRPMNHFLITRDPSAYKFGQFETVSFALGMNKQLKTLSWFGRQIADLLNWLDPDHVENALRNDRIVVNFKKEIKEKPQRRRVQN